MCHAFQRKIFESIIQIGHSFFFSLLFIKLIFTEYLPWANDCERHGRFVLLTFQDNILKYLFNDSFYISIPYVNIDFSP